MIEYALNRSYEEMKKTMADAKNDLNNDVLKREVNFRVGTFLHWLIDWYDRIAKTSEVAQEAKSFFSGLHYANNKLKHDVNTIVIYERKGGFSFPISYPFSIPEIEFLWCDYNKEDNPKLKTQYAHYVCFIQGKGILKTADKALSIIDALQNREVNQ